VTLEVILIPGLLFWSLRNSGWYIVFLVYAVVSLVILLLLRKEMRWKPARLAASPQPPPT
jgi:uncharacterized membrane protein